MAYSLTTASSIDDVISQFCQYAVDHAGFASQSSTTVLGRNVFRISKNGVFWSFRGEQVINASYGNVWRIRSYMTTSLVNLADPTSIQGQASATMTSLWNFPGPYPSMYLFSEGTCVHMVLEVTTGVFTHMSIGNITKTDTFTGGEYLVGNFCEYRSPYVIALGAYPYSSNMQDGYSSIAFLGDNGIGTAGGGTAPSAGFWSQIRNVSVTPPKDQGGNFNQIGPAAARLMLDGTYETQCAGMGGAFGINQQLFRDMPNTATLRSPILPMYVTLRDPTNGLRDLAGFVPNVRFCPMNYLDPGEIILTDWIVFPYIAKESNLINYPQSGNYGLAYRRVP